MNSEIREILDYCESNGVMILIINVPSRSFIIQGRDGTPTSCSFDEIIEK